jgi:hypothetical protein
VQFGRRKSLTEEALSALAVATGYYIVTQVLRPHLLIDSDRREALKALSLGEVGEQTVVARRADNVEVLAHALPLVKITPLGSPDDQVGLTVLERPLVDIAALPGSLRGPVADLYFQLKRAESPVSSIGHTESRSMPSDSLIRKTATQISPDMTEEEISSLVPRLRDRSNHPRTPQERLETLRLIEGALESHRDRSSGTTRNEHEGGLPA